MPYAHEVNICNLIQTSGVGLELQMEFILTLLLKYEVEKASNHAASLMLNCNFCNTSCGWLILNCAIPPCSPG